MVSAAPRGIVHIDDNTVVELLPEYRESSDGERRADVTYDDLGGMKDTIDALREMVELPLRHPNCSSGSASIRPRASCSTARRAPARPPGARRRQ